MKITRMEALKWAHRIGFYTIQEDIGQTKQTEFWNRYYTKEIAFALSRKEFYEAICEYIAWSLESDESTKKQWWKIMQNRLHN